MPIFSPDAKPLEPPHPALDADSIVRRLAPFLLPERRERIEKVLSQRLVGVTVVLDRPHDPHNVSAVMRSCEALGLLQLHVVPEEGGLSLSRKISIGCDKWLNVYCHEHLASCFVWLRQRGFVLLAAMPPKKGRAAQMNFEVSQRPVAIVLGNEHRGLTAKAVSACDRHFHLPIYGFSESYNLSVSAALALARAALARRQALGECGDLTELGLRRLRAAYYARSTRHAPSLLLEATRRGPEQ